jgi:hypothetical protein
LAFISICNFGGAGGQLSDALWANRSPGPIRLCSGQEGERHLCFAQGTDYGMKPLPYVDHFFLATAERFTDLFALAEVFFDWLSHPQSQLHSEPSLALA